MCYYLWLAVKAREKLSFRPASGAFVLTEAGDTPLTRATTGGWTGASSYLVVASGCSCDLVHGRRAAKAKADLIRLLATLLDREHSVHVLLHWSGGMLALEPANLVRKEPITLEAFAEQFPQIDEDVQYVIAS